LLTQPLGVKAAVNPVESSGADEPEVLDDARTNAPLGLLTLGRAVSLSDYEDFSRAFAGVSKAKAVTRSVHGVPGIYITVSGPEGTILGRQSKTYKNLLSALQSSGDPYTHFSVLSYRPAYLKLMPGFLCMQIINLIWCWKTRVWQCAMRSVLMCDLLISQYI